MRTRLFVSNQWMESSNQKTVERSNVAKNIQRYEPNQPYLTSYNRFEEENVLPPSYDTTTVNNEKEWYRDEMNKIRCIERNKVTNYSINYLVNWNDFTGWWIKTCTVWWVLSYSSLLDYYVRQYYYYYFLSTVSGVGISVRLRLKSAQILLKPTRHMIKGTKSRLKITTKE